MVTMQYRKVADIAKLEGNPRKIDKEDMARLKQSIEGLPDYFEAHPIVLSDRTGKLVVIDGNQRLEAARQLGWEEIPTALLSGLTEEKEREIIIRANVNNGEWDMDLLQEWDKEQLEDWGVSVEWEEPEEQKEAEEDNFTEEDAEKAEARVKPGEVWKLGEHRLMCGDSTDADCVAKLMNGEKADIAFSSPPYNAGTTPTEVKMNRTTKYNGNDDDKCSEDYSEFLQKYIRNAIANSSYVFCNVQSISNNKIALIDLLYNNKDIYADTIIWDKINGQPAMANNVMNSVFEYVHIFSRKANRAIGTIDFRGTIDNILHLQSQRNNEYAKIHNATFSVEFASYFISRFAKKSVLDNFGGTGTTLIASEQLNRKCFMMEYDPHYCDVIIARWEKLTGKQAERIEE